MHLARVVDISATVRWRCCAASVSANLRVLRAYLAGACLLLISSSASALTRILFACCLPHRNIQALCARRLCAVSSLFAFLAIAAPRIAKTLLRPSRRKNSDAICSPAHPCYTSHFGHLAARLSRMIRRFPRRRADNGRRHRPHSLRVWALVYFLVCSGRQATIIFCSDQ